jgi:hypothetical protein
MAPSLQEMRAEIEPIKVEIGSTPTASPINIAIKNVTLVAGIKDWTWDSRGRTVYEFFAQIDTYAKVSNWADDEKALIAKAKLQVTSGILAFLSACTGYGNTVIITSLTVHFVNNSDKDINQPLNLTHDSCEMIVEALPLGKIQLVTPKKPF